MAAITGGMRQTEKALEGWKEARPLLEQWRRELVEVDFELKQSRVFAAVLTSSAWRETIEANTAHRIRGQVGSFTDTEVTVRRPSGAMLVLDNNEIAAGSDGKI